MSNSKGIDNRIVRVALVTLLLSGLVPLAKANGAMGLALEMFDYEYWWPYVLATILLEAWMIGRKLGDGWLKALGLSFLANLMTAGCCASGCFAVGLHAPFIGSALNPNPFVNALVLFTGFGLLSGVFETAIWGLGRKGASDRSVLMQSLVAHIAGIPLAMAILLIPSHPYRGLVITTRHQRTAFLSQTLKAYESSADEHSRKLPEVMDATDLVKRFGPNDWSDSSSGAWAAAYFPDFGRFDVREEKRRPYEWNRLANGLAIGGDSDLEQNLPPIWLLRVTSDGKTYSGFVIDLPSGHIHQFLNRSRELLDANAAAVLKAQPSPDRPASAPNSRKPKARSRP